MAGRLAIGLLAAVLAGCTTSPDPGSPGLPSQDYLPGRSARLHLPEATEDPVPVVLLIPGGGWQTADPAGLVPLADALAGAGMVGVTITYLAGQDGAQFPQPVQDVACAAGFAVDRARAEGYTPGPLVVLGHSAGAHLAALAATADPAPADDCPYPPVTISGLVGLAGVYDTGAFEFALVDFFGSARADDPDRWAQGDPIARVAAGGGDDLRVLLRHGDADDVVPVSQSQAFEAVLRSAGIPVRLDVLPGIGHGGVFSAEVSAQPVVDWVRTL